MVALLCIIIFGLTIAQQVLVNSIATFSLPRSKLGVKAKYFLLDQMFQIILSDCVKECLYVKSCESVSYNKVKRTCWLYRRASVDVPDDHWVQDNDSIFADRTDIPMVIAGTCAIEPCSSSEKCIPGRPPICLVYCGKPPVNTNGKFIEGCITVGCVAKGECHDNYISTSPDMIITCQANATWTPLKYECIADCGAPPNVTNAIVQPGLETYNTNRTYTCLEPYTVSSTSTSITCQSDTTWTTPEFQCT